MIAGNLRQDARYLIIFLKQFLVTDNHQTKNPGKDRVHRPNNNGIPGIHPELGLGSPVSGRCSTATRLLIPVPLVRPVSRSGNRCLEQSGSDSRNLLVQAIFSSGGYGHRLSALLHKCRNPRPGRSIAVDYRPFPGVS